MEVISAVTLLSVLKAVYNTGMSARGANPQREEQSSSIKHTVSVALAEVLAHAYCQARVSEGGKAESPSSRRLAVTANIAGNQWNAGAGTVADRNIGRDIGCEIVRDADDRIGDGKGAQAEKEDEGNHTWIVMPLI